MNYSNIRIVNQPLDPALGWTTINQGPNSIQVPPPPPRPPFSGPGMGNNQGTPPPRPPFSGPGMGNNQGTPPPPPRPPFSGPGMGNNQGTPPPPPNFTPQKNQGQVSTFAIDSGSIRGCLYRWVYIWPSRSNRGFWLYLTYVGRRSIAGFRTSRRGFSYYGVDVNQIDSFQCY